MLIWFAQADRRKSKTKSTNPQTFCATSLASTAQEASIKYLRQEAG